MKKYIIATIGILIVETIIAIYFKDSFIRPFFGDFLATILVYCFFRIFTTIRVSAWLAILISYFLEFLQAIHFLKFSGLAKYRIVAIILGSSFAWEDILAYSLGLIFVLIIDLKFSES